MTMKVQSAFLGKEDVERLTGYARTSKQIEWLRANAILFWVNARGEAIVPRSAIDGRGEKAQQAKAWEPDLSSINPQWKPTRKPG